MGEDMETSAEVIVFEDKDGILLFGSDEALAEVPLDSLASRALSPRNLAGLGGILSGVSQAQQMSGRWVKMTSESAALVRKHGESLAKADGLMTGVVRGDKGRIIKHLKFENAALLTPAGPAVLGAVATQAALDAALAEIKQYLETIDAKLDRLLKQRKIEALGQLGGVTFAIEEAESIRNQTGTVSAVTWSKVQANSLALQSMQAEAVAQLSALGEEIVGAGKDPDKIAVVLGDASDGAQFWLGILARTTSLQDRQYQLELDRVAEQDVTQLDAHREGIRVARSERLRRIGAALATIATAVREASSSSTLTKVVNPLSVPRVVKRSNVINGEIGRFALLAGLDELAGEEIAATPWGAAVQTLLGDARTAVSSTATEAGERVADVVTNAGVGLLGGAAALGRRAEELRDRAVRSRRTNRGDEG